MNDVFHAYTRQQAIADGVLIDVSTPAREAGFRFPVAVTSAVWAEYVAVPDGAEGQDESGRLWDILWMLRHAIKQKSHMRTLMFVVLVKNDDCCPRGVRLKSICGPGDDGEPVITILLPDED